MPAVVRALWDEALTPEVLRTEEGHDDPGAEVLEIHGPGLQAEADESKNAQGLSGRSRGSVMR